MCAGIVFMLSFTHLQCKFGLSIVQHTGLLCALYGVPDKMADVILGRSMLDGCRAGAQNDLSLSCVLRG